MQILWLRFTTIATLLANAISFTVPSLQQCQPTAATPRLNVPSLLAAASNDDATSDDNIDTDESATIGDLEPPSQTDKLELECSIVQESDRLKNELFQLAASYDRGFGASPKARDRVNGLIQALEACNEQAYAAQNIEGTRSNMVSPLTGTWRMIWTTAVDVLLLQASPVATVGAIHQVFEPPLITNVIDFIPRIQSLIPPPSKIFPSFDTLVRARVGTRASLREGYPNRIGLVFESVQLQPVQVLGQTLDIFPPLQFDLPRLPSLGITDNNNSQNGSVGMSNRASADTPGFFDVSYQDETLLIIRQNEPGGLFCLVKVDSLD